MFIHNHSCPQFSKQFFGRLFLFECLFLYCFFFIELFCFDIVRLISNFRFYYSFGILRQSVSVVSFLSKVIVVLLINIIRRYYMCNVQCPYEERYLMSECPFSDFSFLSCHQLIHNISELGQNESYQYANSSSELGVIISLQYQWSLVHYHFDDIINTPCCAFSFFFSLFFSVRFFIRCVDCLTPLNEKNVILRTELQRYLHCNFFGVCFYSFQYRFDHYNKGVFLVNEDYF